MQWKKRKLLGGVLQHKRKKIVMRGAAVKKNPDISTTFVSEYLKVDYSAACSTLQLLHFWTRFDPLYLKLPVVANVANLNYNILQNKK